MLGVGAKSFIAGGVTLNAGMPTLLLLPMHRSAYLVSLLGASLLAYQGLLVELHYVAVSDVTENFYRHNLVSAIEEGGEGIVNSSHPALLHGFVRGSLARGQRWDNFPRQYFPLYCVRQKYEVAP